MALSCVPRTLLAAVPVWRPASPNVSSCTCRFSRFSKYVGWAVFFFFGWGPRNAASLFPPPVATCHLYKSFEVRFSFFLKHSCGKSFLGTVSVFQEVPSAGRGPGQFPLSSSSFLFRLLFGVVLLIALHSPVNFSFCGRRDVPPRGDCPFYTPCCFFFPSPVLEPPAFVLISQGIFVPPGHLFFFARDQLARQAPCRVPTLPPKEPPSLVVFPPLTGARFLLCACTRLLICPFPPAFVFFPSLPGLFCVKRILPVLSLFCLQAPSSFPFSQVFLFAPSYPNFVLLPKQWTCWRFLS